ncbi:MAG: TetR/AcrR family transcriptional regulator [Clostridia bacterium]|nr:TetR/AcrR family transcriptional regulator [Clostridia bacterium]
MPKRGADTKAKIVTAAWDLFYRQGYDDTTVDDIVELSGTSKGSFYHHFESKDALLGSLAYLFDRRYEELSADIDPEADAFETLLMLNRELFDLIDNRIDQNLISRLYSTQLMSKGERSLVDGERLYYRLLRRIVADGQKRGFLTGRMSTGDIVRLYALCERALICEWCLCGFTFSLKALGEYNLPTLLAGIRGEGGTDANDRSGTRQAADLAVPR